MQRTDDALRRFEDEGGDTGSLIQGTTGPDGMFGDSGNFVSVPLRQLGSGARTRAGLVKADGAQSEKGGSRRKAGLAQFAKVEGRLERQCVAEGRVRGFDLAGGLKTVLDCSKGKKRKMK